MHTTSPGLKPTPTVRSRTARASGFTLIEVMVAGLVLIFGITSSIGVLRSGFSALDNARNTTLATQIMQSEMERIRLLPWDTSSYDASGALKPAVIRLPSQPTDIELNTIFPAGASTTLMSNRFTVTRTSVDVTGKVGEMKEIKIIITWRGIDGVSHTRTSTTQYAKNGLYDYYYTKARI